MAVPKRRSSKARKYKRRSHNALSAPSFSKCSNCGAVVLPHRACPSCGYYKRRSVFIPKED